MFLMLKQQLGFAGYRLSNPQATPITGDTYGDTYKVRMVTLPPSATMNSTSALKA
jgi:hypothetical protein